MAGGHMTVEQLTAMLNTIPTGDFVCGHRQYQPHFLTKVQKCSKDREWRSTERYSPATRRRLNSRYAVLLKSSERETLDKVPVWMDKNGRTMLVTYMAVRDKSGKYLGTMELVQDMEFAKEYFQK